MAKKTRIYVGKLREIKNIRSRHDYCQLIISFGDGPGIHYTRTNLNLDNETTLENELSTIVNNMDTYNVLDNEYELINGKFDDIAGGVVDESTLHEDTFSKVKSYVNESVTYVVQIKRNKKRN